MVKYAIFSVKKVIEGVVALVLTSVLCYLTALRISGYLDSGIIVETNYKAVDNFSPSIVVCPR